MPKLLEEIHPGEILLEDFMKPMGISARQLAAVRFRRVAGELYLRAFAVFKDEEQISRVVARENRGKEAFSLVESKLAGKIVSK